MAPNRILVAGLLLGAAAICIARDASAQTRIPRVGVLSMSAPDPARQAAFRDALGELGWIEGQNIRVEWHWAAGRTERLAELAGQLVRSNVDVIVGQSTPAVHAAKDATGTIPIVMATAADPVGTGLIASLARPGGNITGVSLSMPDLAGKRLELVRQVLPGVSRVAFLAHAGDPAHVRFLEQTEAAAKVLRVKVQRVVIGGPTELDGAFAALRRDRPGALIVQPIFTAHYRTITELALAQRLPAVSDSKVFAESGGLMAYGPNIRRGVVRGAFYVDRILKGAKPADLPVEQPTTFELVINLKTAKALGITIPSSVLSRADQVIDP